MGVRPGPRERSCPASCRFVLTFFTFTSSSLAAEESKSRVPVAAEPFIPPHMHFETRILLIRKFLTGGMRIK